MKAQRESGGLSFERSPTGGDYNFQRRFPALAPDANGFWQGAGTQNLGNSLGGWAGVLEVNLIVGIGMEVGFGVDAVKLQADA